MLLSNLFDRIDHIASLYYTVTLRLDRVEEETRRLRDDVNAIQHGMTGLEPIRKTLVILSAAKNLVVEMLHAVQHDGFSDRLLEHLTKPPVILSGAKNLAV
jgi:hypothetical protein